MLYYIIVYILVYYSYIFEELKGAENAEIILDRTVAD